MDAVDVMSGETYDQDEHESLEHLISIWPITSTIATHLPAGDLISLSRTSRTFRSYTHGYSYTSDNPATQVVSSVYQPQSANLAHDSSLNVGNHQTPRWANLKSLAPFVCSFPSHKDPKSAKLNPCRPCKFCSRPICRTCIVRSFFTDPKSSKDTYRYRTRHLCPKCWSTGNLRKDFRYPADAVSREQVWRGRSYAQRGNWCACSASEDNWVCKECRTLQNRSGQLNLAISEAPSAPPSVGKGKDTNAYKEVRCYGLDCDAMIREVDRDRRRICLWCSKPLMRQYGGEDRLRWEEKQVEIRAAAAASRSADIEEWARNRFRSLTMSRREMRGTEACIELTGSDSPEHDQRIFVRHLDATNYRKHMNEAAAPSPDSVYKSKHGRWTYSREFFLRVILLNRAKDLPPPAGTNAEYLFTMTKANGLRGARRNLDLNHGLQSRDRGSLFNYAAQFQEAGLMDKEGAEWVTKHLWDGGSKKLNLRDHMFAWLAAWENLPEDRRNTWSPPSFRAIAAKAGFVLEREESDKSAKDKKLGSDAGTATSPYTKESDALTVPVDSPDDSPPTDGIPDEDMEILEQNDFSGAHDAESDDCTDEEDEKNLQVDVEADADHRTYASNTQKAGHDDIDPDDMNEASSRKGDKSPT